MFQALWHLQQSHEIRNPYLILDLEELTVCPGSTSAHVNTQLLTAGTCCHWAWRDGVGQDCRSTHRGGARHPKGVVSPLSLSARRVGNVCLPPGQQGSSETQRTVLPSHETGNRFSASVCRLTGTPVGTLSPARGLGHCLVCSPPPDGSQEPGAVMFISVAPPWPLAPDWPQMCTEQSSPSWAVSPTGRLPLPSVLSPYRFQTQERLHLLQKEVYPPQGPGLFRGANV